MSEVGKSEELLFWILHRMLENNVFFGSANLATSTMVLCMYNFVFRDRRAALKLVGLTSDSKWERGEGMGVAENTFFSVTLFNFQNSGMAIALPSTSPPCFLVFKSSIG